MDVPEFLQSIMEGASPESAHSDISAFDAAFSECREIFLERRREYGSHLEKPAVYIRDNLRTKMTRAAGDIDTKNTVKRDTLIDLACYALMALSKRHAR